MNHIALYAVAVLVLANYADILTTQQALARGAREANPVVRWVMDKTGSFWPAFKIIPTIAMIVLASQYPGDTQLAAIIGVCAIGYALVAMRNHRLQRA